MKNSEATNKFTCWLIMILRRMKVEFKRSFATSATQIKVAEENLNWLKIGDKCAHERIWGGI